MKIKNPKLTLTVGAGISGGIACALDDNNELIFINIDDGNDTYETVALRKEDKFVGAGFINLDVEISNAVNCTLETNIVFITDPTKDASCTVSAVPGLDNEDN